MTRKKRSRPTDPNPPDSRSPFMFFSLNKYIIRSMQNSSIASFLHFFRDEVVAFPFFPLFFPPLFSPLFFFRGIGFEAPSDPKPRGPIFSGQTLGGASFLGVPAIQKRSLRVFFWGVAGLWTIFLFFLFCRGRGFEGQERFLVSLGSLVHSLCFFFFKRVPCELLGGALSGGLSPGRNVRRSFARCCAPGGCAEVPQ